MTKYHLQILTPEEVFFDGEVVSLIAPGTDGYLGVLANHTPLITSLKVGTLTLTNVNNEKTYYKVSKGFLEVAHNKASIVVDSIEQTTTKFKV